MNEQTFAHAGNHEFIFRMLMQGQNKLRISNMAAQRCHFVRNLSL